MISFLLPRGIRNNNPGNLRLGKTSWQGQKAEQSDTSFVEFTDGISGLRALMKTLMTYQVKYGLDSVESIINRYAPPHENATDHYIHNVTRAMGIRRRDKIDLTNAAIMIMLARAIVRQENGDPPQGRLEGWYSREAYETAFRSL